MNNKLAQFVFFVNKIDRRHIQFAWFGLFLAVGFITQKPSDGGTGPY
jgi:hypothetical protein